ncbi:YfjI family protein [Thiorhodovibrio frisius]|uniref:Uncharacterized protein n=1 Tax=Thiorhodovibrio frisius TaxID=631362 RepID=H8Z716_9GAMM|nr:YfjI family protein [Thiorhodovibrio frisius]EIC20815.1 hypothetical protein Thi970DRAFT_04479 [Thiorhodovibrio frisius]WPL21867.1 hypothetical protein Thiofri_02004 [Thiorhodovibrio frisius]
MGEFSISNADFLKAVFHTIPEGAAPVVVGFHGDPHKVAKSHWATYPVNGSLPACLAPGTNQYFSTASVRPDESGRFSRRNPAAVHALVIDDVGSNGKVDRDLITIPPSWELETSPDNAQLGFILDRPITDLDLFQRVLKALKAKGYTDPNGNNPVRLVRLPEGVNAKASVIDHHGEPFPGAVWVWAPELRYALPDLVTGLGLKLDDAPKPSAEPPAPEPGEWDQAKARKIAWDAARRTHDNPQASRHGEIFKMGAFAARDGLPQAALESMLKEFVELMRAADTNGEPAEVNWASERAAIRDGWANGAKDRKKAWTYSPPNSEAAPAPPDLPEPTPLPSLPAVPELPLDILPDALRPWVEDCADRARFPADFVAIAGMVSLGSVVGRRIGIRLKRDDDWTEYPNVWGLNIGPPSALKSPAAGQALKPLKRLQVTADESNAQASAAHEAEMEGYQLRKAAVKKDNAKKLSKDPGAKIEPFTEPPPDAPPKMTYWTSNATAEALGVLLAENPNGLLVERDEISALLKDLEDDANATARGLYLSGWSGKEGYRFDRIIRGTTTLPKYALSVFGGIQPGPLSRYVRGAATGDRADGLLQRFQLATWPDPVGFEYVDRAPNANAREEAFNLFSRTDSLDFNFIGHPDRFDDDVKFVRLQPSAQELFIEWYTAFMLERRANEANRAESESLAAHLGKYPGLLGKIALILHIADDYQTQAVSQRTLMKALAWLEYLAPHAERIYHAAESPETTAANLLLARLRKPGMPTQFRAWEIVRNGWHGLTDRDAVKRACRLLYEYGWLIEIPQDTSGPGRKPDALYSVNPRAGV